MAIINNHPIRQIDVDNSVERNLSKFKKTLNLNDMIRTVTKLSSDYVDFVDNYESRKLDKKRRLIEAGEKLQKKLKKCWLKNKNFHQHLKWFVIYL